MKHIQSLIETEKTWCGELITLGFGEPPFRSLDQVSISGLFPAQYRKPICKTCIQLCAQSILNNLEANTNDNQN